ncbi:apolipoprotein N-acyltransferase [Streptomyces sp. NPDC059740]|uniref:apolipoprotein N-acyltransferase n=1 Tax=Streptomyces sp. NPDC059740 TaxID=3346926 RepID=UPI00366A404D
MPSGSSPLARTTPGAALTGAATDGVAPRSDGSEAEHDGPRPVAARPGRLRRLGALLRREAYRSLLAVVCGLALGLAFPPYDLWPLSFLAVTALALLVHGRTFRQGLWTGFAFGVPFLLLLLRWLHVVGWDAVVGLSVIEAVFVAVMGGGIALASRLPLWPLWGACLWVAQEWARDRVPFGGFPWGRLAFANAGSPFTPLAALGGAPLVTFAVALVGGMLAAALVRLARLTQDPAARTRHAVTTASAVVLAALLACSGLAVPLPHGAHDAGVPGSTGGGGETVDVAVVQGNVERPGMDFLGRPMQILDNHATATERLAAEVRAGKARRPDLVLWPENSSDLDPYTYPEAYERIDEAVKDIGVPVLVGALVDHPTKPGYVFNEGIVWDPRTGPGASYTKQHPVPFGEYVPFRAELSKVITRLQRIPRDFYPGDHTGVLKLGPAKLGDVICFEVAYDEIVRDTANAGARALVVQTNNATYGRTGQPEQQLAMSRLRAVEHGRAVVTAATSGISAVVAPDGTVVRRLPEFTRGVMDLSIPLRDNTTPADRVGAAPEWVLAMVGVLSCVAAVVLTRRGRGRNQRGLGEQ